MTKILGTVLASPIVQGASDIDSYATHYSHLGMGGYREVNTIAERNAIPVDPLNRLEHTGATAMGSGQRRLGMLVYVPATDIVYKLTVPYNTWTGLTTVNKVAALANNANWVEFSSGSGGDAIKKKYNQGGHGFAVGTVIAYNGTIFVPKLAAPSDSNETIGIVSKIDDVNNFTVTYAGFMDTSAITGLSANTVYYVSPFVAGKVTAVEPLNLGDENRPILITQTPTTGLVVQYRGQIITENVLTGGTGTTNVAGVIGPAEDGTYTDGLFTDFVPSTPTGTAVDRFNELFKALAPSPAPDLTNIGQIGTLNSAKLSFGTSRNDIGYANVTTAAGNTAVDINGIYLASGTRLGVTNTVVTGKLNNNVPLTTSYASGAFGEGDKGKLEMYVNGVFKGSLLLSGTTGSMFTTRFIVSAVSAVTFTNGQQLNLFKYRTGSFQVQLADMVTGFNYVRILHVKPTGTIQTNYLEWVYDTNAVALSTASTSLSGLALTGSKFISGVRYNTGGTVTYNTTLSNAFRNVYPNGNAISYPTRTNLSDSGVITKTGGGVITDATTSKAFPLLNSAVSNPEATSMTLSSVHTLQNNILGNIGSLGKIETNISIVHPLKATFTGAVATNTGFLQYTPVQVSNLKTENFTGELNRIHDRDYTALTYANINSGTYVWDSTQSLVGANVQHNTGLLVFNGELMYPNTTYLNTTYGISGGNFGGVTNILAGNPNYSTASGIRVFDRKFKSSNFVTQSTLTIEFLHTGSNSSFLTDFSAPSSNFIRVECMIKRAGGATHGWFNPFASTGNPEGIANTAISTIAGGTSVSCTLSTVPRIGDTDIVVVRIYAAASWTNRISNINVVNI